MEYRPLGRSGLMVSALGLGTMTWGNQNTEAEGHAQMDMALDHGITFWDTAEMYAIPPAPETHGRTEEIIGNWFATRGQRDRIVLASKVAGPNANAWVRGGKARLDRPNIERALDDSLRRLKTDRIDLYQLHWPERVTPRFGQRCYTHAPERDGVPIEETLGVLADLIKAGKIRAFGVSNETAWGVSTYLKLAETRGFPRLASIQNAYNLLNRTFESALSEFALREEVGLIAYAPLAAGTLTGKYLDGAIPPGTRRSMDTRPSRYTRPNADPAVRAYHAVAARHGLSPIRMSIAFAASRPFVASALIGATSLEQLASDIAAFDLTLSAEVLKDIDEVHNLIPDPCP